MKILSILLQIIRDGVVFVCFVGLLLFTLSGVIFPDHPGQQAFGQFQVAPFSIDLAIFQPDKNGHYYSLSPFNDYMITDTGERQAFLTVDELKNNSFKIRQPDQVSFPYLQAIETLFRTTSPVVTFDGTHTVEYTTHIADNVLDVQRQVMLNPGEHPTIVGTTMSFDPGDFVFAPSGQLYLPKTASEMQLFEQLTGKHLLPATLDRRQVVKASTLIISNQKLPGFLVVQASPHQTIIVDQDYQLIELTEAVDEGVKTSDTLTTSVRFKAVNTLQELE